MKPFIYENRRPLRIALVASEAVPFAKTGGLADVTGGLAVALGSKGHDVTLLHPFYQIVDENCRQYQVSLQRTSFEFEVRVGEVGRKGRLWAASCGERVQAYLIENQDYFGSRRGIYQENEADYPDNPERFVFFCEAALAALRSIGKKVDILHCHDWQTGFIPAYLNFRQGEDDFFSRVATVFTIHNLLFQGLFPSTKMRITNLPWGAYNSEGVEFYGQINPMKAGLVYSTLITTVSKKYASEIMTEELGFGLEGVVKKRRADLYAILNGADYGVWDPGKDPHLPVHYCEEDMSGKEMCRDDLVRTLKLDLPPGVALIGMVSRLTRQKGLDLLLQAASRLMQMEVALVILGEGEQRLHQLLQEFAGAYPGRVRVVLGFNENLAHKIIAGCDFFLLPSQFEPGGVAQLHSLKYGTIPIVRSTGGLDDTIENYDSSTGNGNGFKFAAFMVQDLLDKISEALTIIRQPDHWLRLRKNAMACDFSWERPILEYERVYLEALSRV